jgi:hypothetical protein
MSKLTDAVEAKLAADGVSATAAAKAAGLSLPSFRAVLKGKSVPNARGLKKYAKLLGISEEEVNALASDSPKAKRGRKAKAKAKAKPGRKGKPGRKPGRKAKAKGKPGRKAKIGVAAAVMTLLSQAEEILGDDLAVAVHGLGKAQRATVGMIINSLG